MSHLIGMYLFKINVDIPEDKIDLKHLSDINNIIISDSFMCCKTQDLKNGEWANSVSYGCRLFKDSKRYAELLQKTIDHIKGSMYSAQLDSDILETISIVENNWFFQCLLKTPTPQSKTPGYHHVIFNLDKGFYEFIKCHLALNRYHFNKHSYKFIKISKEEMLREEERELFMSDRAVFRVFGIEKIRATSESIISLEPSKERLAKSVGVLLEMLVYYDSETKKHQEVLQLALKLAEYIRINSTEKRETQCALLNCLQIKKRLNVLVDNDLVILHDIMTGTNMPDDIVLGAAIIYGDYITASHLLEHFSKEEKELFVQLPIYRLWPNPPIKANLDPHLFTVF